LEFKFDLLFYSSVCSAASVSRLLFQLLELLFLLAHCWLATFSAAAGAAFQLHQLLCQFYQKVLQQFVTKDKILSIDLEASSFDGITNSTSRES
jgi:hypothetical protein